MTKDQFIDLRRKVQNDLCDSNSYSSGSTEAFNVAIIIANSQYEEYQMLSERLAHRVMRLFVIKHLKAEFNITAK